MLRNDCGRVPTTDGCGEEGEEDEGEGVHLVYWWKIVKSWGSLLIEELYSDDFLLEGREAVF